jgi:hypothetical protein
MKYGEMYTTLYLEWNERLNHKNENCIFIGENSTLVPRLALHYFLAYGNDIISLREKIVTLKGQRGTLLYAGKNISLKVTQRGPSSRLVSRMQEKSSYINIANQFFENRPITNLKYLMIWEQTKFAFIHGEIKETLNSGNDF